MTLAKLVDKVVRPRSNYQFRVLAHITLRLDGLVGLKREIHVVVPPSGNKQGGNVYVRCWNGLGYLKGFPEGAHLRLLRHPVSHSRPGLTQHRDICFLQDTAWVIVGIIVG